MYVLALSAFARRLRWIQCCKGVRSTCLWGKSINKLSPAHLYFFFNAFLIIVAQYGTTAYAAYGIGIQILAFSFVIGFGFSMAGASLVGQHMGAEDNLQAKRSAWSGMRLSISFMTIFGVFIILFAEKIVGFLIDDAEVIRLTVIFIWIMGSLQPLMAIEFSLGGALRGAGDTKSPLLITLTCLFFQAEDGIRNFHVTGVQTCALPI